MDRFEVIENNQIKDEAVMVVMQLKNQHWPYGIDSQKQWISENLNPMDMHCMLYVYDENNILGGTCVAYLNLININLNIDDVIYQCVGIGNVCVDKKYEHKGYGRKLFQNVNSYLDQNNRMGVLLCKPELEPFYSKSSWRKAFFDECYVNSYRYNNTIMMYNVFFRIDSIRKILINRNF